MTATARAGTPKPADLSSDRKLTARELDQARLFLEQTRDAVIGATRGLSGAQWKFKSAPDRWSIAENLDHIVQVQERVLGPILAQLANAPAPPHGLDDKLVDTIVINQFSNRLTRYPAPEFVHPAGEIAPSELLNRLTANYARLADCLESTPGLRQHVLPAPPLKAVSNGAFELMDGYQWILAVAAHTERHVKQILEVKAGPRYPV
jgi:hypothetical protein